MQTGGQRTVGKLKGVAPRDEIEFIQPVLLGRLIKEIGRKLKERLDLFRIGRNPERGELLNLNRIMELIVAQI